MATKKQTPADRIPVNGVFGPNIEDIKKQIEALDARRATLLAVLQNTVMLAGQAESVPIEYQFDLDTVEFYRPPEEGEGDAT